MKKIIFYLPVIIFLTASCGTSKTENNIAAKGTDTVTCTYKTVGQKENIENAKDSNAAKVSITYPEIHSSSAIADSINAILQDYVFNKYESAQVAADSFIDQAVQAKKQINGASVTGWFYTCSASLIRNSPGFAVLKIESSSYTGGAHPGSFIFYYNFDSTGKNLSWDDIIEPGKKDTLIKLNETLLRADKNIPAGQSWNDAGFLLPNDTLPLPAFFAVTKEGLLITYNQYEVAPYAMGTISYTIPFNKLDGIIKKEWE